MDDRQPSLLQVLLAHYDLRLQQPPYDGTDLLQQVDGVPAAQHLGGEGGSGRGAPVLLDLLQELGHGHALGHVALRTHTGLLVAKQRLTDPLHTRAHTIDRRRAGVNPTETSSSESRLPTTAGKRTIRTAVPG